MTIDLLANDEIKIYRKNMAGATVTEKQELHQLSFLSNAEIVAEMARNYGTDIAIRYGEPVSLEHDSVMIFLRDTKTDKLIGYTQLRLEIDRVKLMFTYVAPQFRRKGYFREMFKFIPTDNPITLTVAQYNNNARFLYEELGFTAVATNMIRMPKNEKQTTT